ncbi:hypothetical protein AAHA92_06354 [Salvia divinorum]|uniref:Uncharacterized protein n=1 Tax=Salvia divinorum TaxID=28513 RepID=A0ABD1I674_SALDI
MEDDEPIVPDKRMKFERDAHTGKLMAHCHMSREITAIFHQIPNPTSFTWASTPNAVKNAYFEEFRKAYFWPDSWEHEVRSLWTKAQKLAKEKGVPISEVSYESFMALHSKNGEFTYKKTADIAAKVQELAATQGENANMNDIFVNQVLGGRLDKKRRMVGIGDLGPCLVVSS